ncbi:RNA polymerase sigma factor [Membranihabitans maritimus]|uniref:RNA polymerase sigma factor n=1 Tax=Membranihabitans maritimus TaxID=2904244 RepID=UPI001F0172D9|nr:sigma-70 family RNA polymerase sigma factor [Membranihabitans maritimus]
MEKNNSIKSLKNNASIEELFKAYHTQVFGFAFKNLKSKSAANDIVQEVFLALCQKDLSKINNIRSFIFQITHHKVIDLLRKRAKDQNLRKEMWDVISQKQVSTFDQILKKEYDNTLEKAINQLTPQQKIIFEMSREEGLSHRKIAQKLELSPNTVKNHMVAALKTLKKYVQLDSDIVLTIVLAMTWLSGII